MTNPRDESEETLDQLSYREAVYEAMMERAEKEKDKSPEGRERSKTPRAPTEKVRAQG